MPEELLKYRAAVDLPLPNGPFTVTVANEDGKLFEVTFPDHTGVLPAGGLSLGTTGTAELLVNLFTGALRISSGRP